MKGLELENGKGVLNGLSSYTVGLNIYIYVYIYRYTYIKGLGGVLKHESKHFHLLRAPGKQNAISVAVVIYSL